MNSNVNNKSQQTMLVTGGAGFVGSHLADKLANDGAQVYALDNLSSGRVENISNNNVKFVCGDIRDANLVEDLVKKSDVVYHLAEYIPETNKFGAGHVIKYSVENPLLDFDVSCYGTLVVLDKCRKYDKKIVFTSSAAVYGASNAQVVDEDSPKVPSSPYGASKLCAEIYVELYSRLYSLPVTILRFSNLYGPRQRKYIIYDILNKLLKNPQKLEILGTGLETRDFIYVQDAISALLLASTDLTSKSRVFNIGTGISTSIKEMIALILKTSNLSPELVFTQASWKGDIKQLTSNSDKLRALGFKPMYSLESGVRETVNWFDQTFKH